MSAPENTQWCVALNELHPVPKFLYLEEGWEKLQQKLSRSAFAQKAIRQHWLLLSAGGYHKSSHGLSSQEQEQSGTISLGRNDCGLPHVLDRPLSFHPNCAMRTLLSAQDVSKA